MCVHAGDIISVAGAAHISIADTLAAPGVDTPLDPGRVDPPTLAMVGIYILSHLSPISASRTSSHRA